MSAKYTTLGTLIVAAMLPGAQHAAAQQFPAKVVRIVVPYAAGGPVDTVGRIAAQNLTARWGQQVIVDNRGGSGGALGTQNVVKSAPDGYSLLLANSGPITAYPHLRKTLLYQFERDLTPISLLTKSSMVLVAHPSLPVKTIPDLVNLAKRQAGVLTYASSGVGGIQHLGMVLLESMAHIRMIHVPYKGAGPAAVDLLSGHVPMEFNNVLGSLPHVKAGRLRALAVSTTEPSPVLPGVPPVAKFYPGFDITSWMGLYGPAAMPKALVDQVNRDIAAALKMPQAKQRLSELGVEVVVTGPAELDDYARKESRLFGKLMAAAGIEKE